MLNAQDLGVALRVLRTTRDLRQRQVAEAAGITPSMLSGYENGKAKPTLDTLEKILPALGCGLGDLAETLHRLAAGSVDRPPPRPRAVPAFTLADLLHGFGPLSRDEEHALGQVLCSFTHWLRLVRGPSPSP